MAYREIDPTKKGEKGKGGGGGGGEGGKRGKKFFLMRQNLQTLEFIEGTIGIDSEELAMDVCRRNNNDDGLGTADNWYWWYEGRVVS